jgi:drug/metabolite transporter (DMT)-like permease
LNGARLVQVLLAVGGISCGQVLLKLAAMHAGQASAARPLALLLNGYLIAGVAVLGCATLLWTWVLRWVPLNQAYPFMALAFVLVPLACWFLLGETLTARQLLGNALIVAGVLVVSL